MAVRIHTTPPAGAAGPPRRRMRAADIPAAPAGQRTHLPYTMLIKDWAWWPADREAMIADEPETADAEERCRIAALVHALCDRDGIAAPGWVLAHRSDRPLPLMPAVPAGGPLWARITAGAPPACAYHNVWFSRRDIETPAAAAERARRGGRARRAGRRAGRVPRLRAAGR